MPIVVSLPNSLSNSRPVGARRSTSQRQVDAAYRVETSGLPGSGQLGLVVFHPPQKARRVHPVHVYFVATHPPHISGVNS
jgi:hypothetical protein